MPKLHHLVFVAPIVACFACSTSSPTDAPEARTATSGSNAETNAPATAADTEARSEVVRSLERAEVAAGAHYLVDPESGRVAMNVPPEILEALRGQLEAAGHGDGADALTRLYDMQTGSVRDEGKAQAADAVLALAVRGGAR